MTDKSYLKVTSKFRDTLVEMVNKFRSEASKPQMSPENLQTGLRPPVRFVTLETYSTYVVREYPNDGYASYDLDGDDRGGQEYAVMVDGDEPIQAALQHREEKGNHKQLISFVGDDIQGSVKLILDGAETDEISLSANVLTEEYLKEKIEALPAIGTRNTKITIYPGRWLVEFTRDLAGLSFDLFEVDRVSSAVYEVHVTETKWNDSGETIDLHYPIPLIGEWDTDDQVVNDAVAAGSIGTAQWFPGIGYVSDLNECRDYNGDGTPEL